MSGVTTDPNVQQAQSYRLACGHCKVGVSRFGNGRTNRWKHHRGGCRRIVTLGDLVVIDRYWVKGRMYERVAEANQ